MDHPDLQEASAVLAAEVAAIQEVAKHLDRDFIQAVELCLQCQGRVVVTGMGKAGLIGHKISATLASTGTPSFFLHPSEAFHGDLGRLRAEDLVLGVSNSGESEEVVRLIEPVKSIGCTLLAMTGARNSRLARFADFHLYIGESAEACPMGLAPTSSTTAMLALGDALAMVVCRRRKFSTEDYARFHPGGSLGRKLMKVDEIMRKGDDHTLVSPETSAHQTLARMNRTRGRPGAASIVNSAGRLVGFVTDGDIVRALELGSEFLNRPISEMMIRSPKTISSGRLASEAARLLRDHRIDQLPVVNESFHPIGLIDQQDLIAARIT